MEITSLSDRPVPPISKYHLKRVCYLQCQTSLTKFKKPIEDY